MAKLKTSKARLEGRADPYSPARRSWLAKHAKANEELKNASNVDEKSEVAATLFLPLEIISDILSRLHIKTIARLRCVCKNWCSLTYNPLFIDEQYKRALLARTSFSIAFLASSRIFIYDFGPKDIIKSSSFFVNLVTGGSNSINGLVCGYHKRDRVCQFYLMNPFIREFIKLPERILEKGNAWPRQLGLGFDISSGDYKLVRVYCNGLGDLINFEVLTVGTQEWRYLGACDFLLVDNPVFLNGALHWLARKRSYCPNGTSILAFDLKDEKFRFMPAPKSMCDEIYFQRLVLQKLEGHLCLVRKLVSERKEKNMKIWMLRDYANLEWELVYDLNLSCWVEETTSYDINIVDVRGAILLLRSNTSIIYSYELNSGTLLKLCCEDCKFSMIAGVITETSLISPRNLLRNAVVQ